MTGAPDIAAVAAALPAGDGRDISRILPAKRTARRTWRALTRRLPTFFRDHSGYDAAGPGYADAGDDTLRSIFIRRLKEKYDAAADSEGLIVRVG